MYPYYVIQCRFLNSNPFCSKVIWSSRLSLGEVASKSRVRHISQVFRIPNVTLRLIDPSVDDRNSA